MNATSGFVGTYRADDGVIILIQPSGNRLEYVDFGSHAFEDLRTMAADAFVAGSGVEITFTRGVGGRVVGLVWRQRGRPDHAARKVTLYREEEVRFRNGDVTLAGVLLVPAGAGPHPAVVMVHGSGPASRRHGSNVPFLAAHGVAVLAYDKRGVGESTSPQEWWQASFDDLADDALAGLTFLKRRKDINARQIGLYGSSQGGWVVALAAARSPEVAFIVTGSGPVVDLAWQERHRVEQQMRADRFSDREVAEAVALMALKFRCVRAGEGWEELHGAARQARQKPWFSYVGALPTPESRQWWLPLVVHDPVSTLERVRCPVLAFFGACDRLVPVQESIARMEQALQGAGNLDYRIDVLPNANHSLLAVESNPGSEVVGRYAPGYRDTLIAWLRAHVDMPGPGCGVGGPIMVPLPAARCQPLPPVADPPAG